MNRSIHINAATAAVLGMSSLGAMTANERTKGRYMRDGGGHPTNVAEMNPEQLAKHFGDALEAVKKVAGEAEKDVKRLGELSAETKTKADEALTRFNVLDELKARVEGLEQKSDRGGGQPEKVKSYGQQVAENDGIKALRDKERNALRIELKAITSASGSAGGLIVSQRETDVIDMPKRPDIILRDLLTVMPTETSSIDYPKQSVRTNAAAPVPEGTAKPYSNYGWTRANAVVRTIAHLAKLTRQALDDAPRLQAEVDAEMRYGLAVQEDAQILLGDGTGENLYGLMPQASAYALPTGATAPTTQIDKLRMAILQSVLALYPAEAFVLNPIDWANIEVLKDSAGGYIFANPLAMAAPTLWGKPVAATQSMTVGNFLTGAFKQAATLYDRLQPEVLISSENSDDFEKNLLTMRCEERVALAVKRSAALIKGTF